MFKLVDFVTNYFSLLGDMFSLFLYDDFGQGLTIGILIPILSFTLSQRMNLSKSLGFIFGDLNIISWEMINNE